VSLEDDRGGAPLALDTVYHFDSGREFSGDFSCVRLVAHHCSGDLLIPKLLVLMIDALLGSSFKSHLPKLIRQ
jgi:hypothetical protein